jgi:hypothetical protein
MQLGTNTSGKRSAYIFIFILQSVIMKFAVERSYEMSITFYQTTRRRLPYERNLYSCKRVDAPTPQGYTQTYF